MRPLSNLRITIQLTGLLVLLLLSASCVKEQEGNTKKILGNDPLGPFLPCLVSTAMYERDMAISPDGKEMIYTLSDPKQSRRTLVGLQKMGDTWGQPEILNISGKYKDIEPFFADNGNRLYFSSNRPLPGQPERNDYNIWFSERTETGWADPVALDSIINTVGDEFYPSLSDNGNLYFTASRKDGKGREDIYLSVLEQGKYKPAISLDSVINTPFYEFNAYVSPGEDLLIFSSYGRKDGFGGGDLYMSEKDSLGNWTQARNLGKEINTEKLDYCPFVDWQAKKFYFTSERSKTLPEHLASKEELMEFGLGNQNGLGDIYQVDLHKIGI